MSATTFFEITLQTAGFTFGGRDKIEDLLDEALQAAGLGEVTGGGSGMGIANIDVEVTDLKRGLALIREVLQTLGVCLIHFYRLDGRSASGATRMPHQNGLSLRTGSHLQEAVTRAILCKPPASSTLSSPVCAIWIAASS